MASAAMLMATTQRNVPRIAPRSLFTSNESIVSFYRYVRRGGSTPLYAKNVQYLRTFRAASLAQPRKHRDSMPRQRALMIPRKCLTTKHGGSDRNEWLWCNARARAEYPG